MWGLSSHLKRESEVLEFIKRSCRKHFSRDHNLNSCRCLESTPWKAWAFLNNAFLTTIFGRWLWWEDFPHGCLFLRVGYSTRGIFLPSCPTGWRALAKEQGRVAKTGKLSFWEVLDVPVTLLVVMGVFAYVQTLQIVHIKYTQFFVGKKAGIKEKIIGKKIPPKGTVIFAYLCS